MKSLTIFLKKSSVPLGFAILLAGCGFHPVYKKTATLDTNKELKKVYIPVLNDRFGQQIRQFLQQNMAGDITFEQYFAQTLNDETAQTRVAQNLANEVTQQVAVWFRHNDSFQETSKVPNTPKAQYMLPSMMPGTSGAQTQSAGSDGMPAMATGRNTMIPVGMDNMTEDEMPSDK